MDGRGRALENVFVERLWRAAKQEDIYIRGYDDVPELRCGLARFFAFYDDARLHQSLCYRTSAAVCATPVPRDRGPSPPASGGSCGREPPRP
jgi:putative transposase